jgi:cyclopropane-fatty-acyl-phospholipid synthase
MGLVPESYVRKQWLDALSRLEFGMLNFFGPNGEHIVAKGSKPGPSARFELGSWSVLQRVLARGDIGLGEEYIAGTWETDDIETLPLPAQH